MAVGYAFGSGDGNPNDRIDRSFRQTGLQDNEDRFHGVTSFKYYSEIFDPEPSNLGFHRRDRHQADQKEPVYHYYLQRKAADEFRDTSIDADPTGRSKRLETEIDLIIGYEELRNVEMKLALGYFIPGKAFRKAGNAFFAGVEIEWGF